eukprot:6293923-Prymnesium_polylepis.1
MHARIDSPPRLTARGAHAPTLTHACTEQTKCMCCRCTACPPACERKAAASSLAAVENSERARAL